MASYRKMGNSEVLIKVALKAAEREGAETELIRLTDLEIRPCKGCMACIFRGERCAIDDDMPGLIDAIVETDGLLVAAPTYVLGPPGIIKMALDRLIELMHPGKLKALGSKRRASGILAVATDPEGWAPFTLPFLKLFCYVCMAPPVDWAIFRASGPGEIALDREALERARKIGSNVVRALRGEEVQRPRVPKTSCPVCGGKLFVLEGDTSVSCPLCGIRGRLVFSKDQLELSFGPDALRKARWILEEALEHVMKAVIPTGEKYKQLLPEIKKALRELAAEVS